MGALDKYNRVTITLRDTTQDPVTYLPSYFMITKDSVHLCSQSPLDTITHTIPLSAIQTILVEPATE